eukprot:SAG25_NODE_1503_length_2882_cov_1.547251_1_plen_97_part_00
MGSVDALARGDSDELCDEPALFTRKFAPEHHLEGRASWGGAVAAGAGRWQVAAGAEAQSTPRASMSGMRAWMIVSFLGLSIVQQPTPAPGHPDWDG